MSDIWVMLGCVGIGMCLAVIGRTLLRRSTKEEPADQERVSASVRSDNVTLLERRRLPSAREDRVERDLSHPLGL
jgi:hypothetical protein